ncbi:hypothetical protein ACFV2N_41520 [Streptomyces sp. NPDC059680]|uniref:hypothetical protein n=1 Tax=Streptomyces sp. NPDC059680 TaxID=3346904 RepID=UPI003696B2F2
MGPQMYRWKLGVKRNKEKEESMGTDIDFAELELLVGEVLPERTVMGNVVVPLGWGGESHDSHAAVGGGGASSASSSAAGGGGGGFGGGFGGFGGFPVPVVGNNHSDTVVSACQSIGQGQSNVPVFTCMPSTMRGY